MLKITQIIIELIQNLNLTIIKILRLSKSSETKHT